MRTIAIAWMVLISASVSAADGDVRDEVNQYLSSDKASQRNSILRSLAQAHFAEVENALRTGTLAQPQSETDTLIERRLTTAYGEREFETLIYIPKNYSAKKRYRLLVALHGTGGNGKEYIQAWLPWIQKRDDTILAAPTIAGEPWGGSRTAHSHVHTLVWHLRGSSPSMITTSLWVACRWAGMPRFASAVFARTATLG